MRRTYFGRRLRYVVAQVRRKIVENWQTIIDRENFVRKPNDFEAIVYWPTKYYTYFSFYSILFHFGGYNNNTKECHRGKEYLLTCWRLCWALILGILATLYTSVIVIWQKINVRLYFKEIRGIPSDYCFVSCHTCSESNNLFFSLFSRLLPFFFFF
jgi:hypothetical protein